MKELQQILSRVRQAAEKYSMIEDGDLVAVGVSGGKDSLALLCALAAMRDFYPHRFDLIALTVDMGFGSVSAFDAPDADLSAVSGICRELGVELYTEKTAIAQIVFDARREKNPCSLCANMRRGALYTLASRHGATKLAIGHHLDDVAETVMLNLIYGGRFGCFSPVTRLDGTKAELIRPLIYCRESLIRRFAKESELPIIESPCPMDRASKRAEMKTLIVDLDKRNRGIREKLLGALERAGIDGWYE